MFRIARIMRIFKLARRSVGLQSMAYTVKNSWQDLFLLASLIMIGMMVFGSLEYYIEMDEEETGFYSIPQGMWWAVQTLTSLGYGDFPVQTIPGKLFGSMCAVSGVLVLALPIPIVVDNFADYYKEQKQVWAVCISAANRLIGEVVQSRRRPLLGVNAHLACIAS